MMFIIVYVNNLILFYADIDSRIDNVMQSFEKVFGWQIWVMSDTTLGRK